MPTGAERFCSTVDKGSTAQPANSPRACDSRTSGDSPCPAGHLAKPGATKKRSCICLLQTVVRPGTCTWRLAGACAGTAQVRGQAGGEERGEAVLYRPGCFLRSVSACLWTISLYFLKSPPASFRISSCTLCFSRTIGSSFGLDIALFLFPEELKRRDNGWREKAKLRIHNSNVLLLVRVRQMIAVPGEEIVDLVKG